MTLHIILPLMLENECRLNSSLVEVTTMTSCHYGTYRTSRAEIGWKPSFATFINIHAPHSSYILTQFSGTDTPLLPLCCDRDLRHARDETILALLCFCCINSLYLSIVTQSRRGFKLCHFNHILLLSFILLVLLHCYKKK